MSDLASWVPLGSVAKIELGKMLSARRRDSGAQFPYLRNQNVQWDRLALSDVAEMGFEEDEVERFSLEPGDLLVCEGGEPGRAALWRGEIAACCYQKALHRVRPHEGVLSEYLLFAIWHLALSGAFADQNAKTTIAHLPLDRLKRVMVPLVGESKQREHVASIRAQFHDVLRASDASKTAEAAGKRLVGAVLRQLFGGPPIAVGAGPQTSRPMWNCEPLASLARLESGHTPSRRHPEWWGGDVPWLALPDIRKLHGKVAHATTETINEAGLANSSARLLPVGTVCVSRTASIGFVTMLGRPMATSQDFCNWVCDPERLDPEYLMYAFMASQDSLRELGSGAVHKTIYMPTIQSFQLHAPVLAEQRRIARTLREQLAAAEALQTRLAERQAEIERLPQRILAAAFGDAE